MQEYWKLALSSVLVLVVGSCASATRSKTVTPLAHLLERSTTCVIGKFDFMEDGRATKKAPPIVNGLREKLAECLAADSVFAKITLNEEDAGRYLLTGQVRTSLLAQPQHASAYLEPTTQLAMVADFVLTDLQLGQVIFRQRCSERGPMGTNLERGCALQFAKALVEASEKLTDRTP